MVKAIIDISDRTNQVLNIVKAKYDLKKKSEAIDLVVKIFERDNLNPTIRPVVKESKKQRVMKVKEVGDFLELSD